MKKWLKAWLLLALTLMLIIAGCSSNSVSSSNSETTTYWLEIGLPGRSNEFPVDGQGKLQSKAEVSSIDGEIYLSIDKGTSVLDKDGNPLQSIKAVIESNSPIPPQDTVIIGTTYKLTPIGATFDPRLNLTMSYDTQELPGGVAEKDLYIAYYDGTQWWRPRYKNVDAQNHSVATQVYHFSTFAILGPTKPVPSSPSTPTYGTKAGDLAPEFQFENIDGKVVSLSDLKGKPLFINLWSQHCGPCLLEIPFIQQVYEEWSTMGLQILTINTSDSPEQVRSFMESNNLSFPVLLDPKGSMLGKYQSIGIPVSFFIDRDGIIQARKYGAFFSKEQIEEYLDTII